MGSIRPDTTKEQIAELIGQYANPISIVYSPEKRRAFIVVATRDGCVRANENLQGAYLNGGRIKVRSSWLDWKWRTRTRERERVCVCVFCICVFVDVLYYARVCAS